MTIEELLGLTKRPVFDKPDEGTGGAGGEGGDTDEDAGGGDDAASGDDANKAGQGTDTSDDDDDGVALDGGTGDDDNSDEGKDGDDGDDDGGDDPVPGEGEDYDFASVMPEGMEVDAEMAAAMTPVLKELGLGTKSAGKLAAAVAAYRQAEAQANADRVIGIVKGWKDTAKSDKEIGHAEWGRSKELANGVIKQFGTPELVQDVMVGQGIGNHPEVIRLLARIGKHIAEDTAMTGEETETNVSPEAAWYGKTTPATKKG
jgi:hypothetical protein